MPRDGTLAEAPLQAAAQDIEKGLADAQEFYPVISFAALDAVTLDDRGSDLSVNAEDAVGTALQADGDAGVIADHEGTVGERVGTDGGEQNRLDTGDQHGTSGGQGVRRWNRWGWRR